jgi:hypothetical protein
MDGTHAWPAGRTGTYEEMDGHVCLELDKSRS